MPSRSMTWSQPEHIVGVSKTTYVLATPRCLGWRHDLRTAPRSHRSRLPSHVRRPYARSKDAAVTSTLGRDPVSTQSLHVGRNMSRRLWPLAALLMVAPGHERRPCGSPPPHRAESLPDHRRPRRRSPWSTRGSLVLRQTAVTARCEALAPSRERGAARRADRERALAVSCLSQSTVRGLRIAPTIGARKGRIMANPAPSHRRFAGLRRWTAGPTHRSP